MVVTIHKYTFCLNYTVRDQQHVTITIIKNNEAIIISIHNKCGRKSIYTIQIITIIIIIISCKTMNEYVHTYPY